MGEWRDKAGPWARATLPDGQALDVIVTRWTRTGDGAWWCECELIAPVRHQHEDGRTEQKAAPVPISVHADRITPIPGEDYRAVPVEGAVAGQQWLAVRIRGTGGDGPWWSVHRRDCWQARGGWQARRITAAEARELLAGNGEGRLCDVCRPDRALRSQGYAPLPDPGPQA